MYFVDARFRVACACQALLHGRDDSLVLIHDFTLRPGYHVIFEVANEVWRSDTLVAVMKKKDVTTEQIEQLWSRYGHEID